MTLRDIFTFWIPFVVAIISLIVNIVQLIGYRKVRNKISIWAKDAKGMASSIVGIQENIKNKKITTMSGVDSNVETLANFANSMFISMEEELGRQKKEITLASVLSSKKKKKEKEKENNK